ASSDSAAPLGLPGRLTMSVLFLTAAVPRESTAVGVCSSPLRRICSEIPGTIRSATACVASGVLSRGPMPVPPVVSKTSTRPESASDRNCSRIPAGSNNRSEEHTSELQSLAYLVCRLLLEKKKKSYKHPNQLH